jgi:hypothetical protein
VIGYCTYSTPPVEHERIELHLPPPHSAPPVRDAGLDASPS